MGVFVFVFFFGGAGVCCSPIFLSGAQALGKQLIKKEQKAA